MRERRAPVQHHDCLDSGAEVCRLTQTHTCIHNKAYEHTLARELSGCCACEGTVIASIEVGYPRRNIAKSLCVCVCVCL